MQAAERLAQIATAFGLDPPGSGLTWAKLPVRSAHSPSSAAPQRAVPSRYVLVTGTTPSGSGQGKTVTAIGLAMALCQAGSRAVVTLRQSSFGPTLGGKGGGAGGGAAHLDPLETALLGLGADQFAVELATNLLAARLDDLVWRGEVDIDPDEVWWRRVVDVDDRSLRHVLTRPSGTADGPTSSTGFDITAAGEIAAIVALASDYADLRERLGRLSLGFDQAGQLVTAARLGAAGALAVLLRDALRPNLMVTVEGTPALVHGGPFANLAHGCSSVIADRWALERADYVVTEAGFGSELGAEKFLHLKVPAVGRPPDVIVLVTTTQTEAANLGRHLANLAHFGVPVVVAINRFPTDDPADLVAVVDAAERGGAAGVAAHEGFRLGSAGCADLADQVSCAAEQPSRFRPMLDAGMTIVERVERLATTLYGAACVRWSEPANRQLDRLDNAGLGHSPVCVAKNPRSVSHDPALGPTPSGYEFPVTGLRPATGAGFVTVFAGAIQTMPGLPRHPRFLDWDLTSDGTITGLA